MLTWSNNSRKTTIGRALYSSVNETGNLEENQNMNVLRSILLSKDNLLDAMEWMLDDLGNIHNQDNFYERMFSMKK